MIRPMTAVVAVSIAAFITGADRKPPKYVDQKVGGESIGWMGYKHDRRSGYYLMMSRD